MITDALQSILDGISEIKRRTKTLNPNPGALYGDGVDVGRVDACDEITLIVLEKMQEYES